MRRLTGCRSETGNSGRSAAARVAHSVASEGAVRSHGLSICQRSRVDQVREEQRLPAEDLSREAAELLRSLSALTRRMGA